MYFKVLVYKGVEMTESGFTEAQPAQTESMASAVKELVGSALGKISSGLYIVTCQGNDNSMGMLASWIMQAGFEPPMLSVALSPERELYKAILVSKQFSIQVVSTEKKTIMKSFYKYTPNQFDTVAHTVTPDGIVLSDAMATLHCKLTEVVPVRDHHLLLGEVLSASRQNQTVEPMVHTRKSGFSY
jgi:flavin reductase (DIM6/NTAB) family NADH-FMN oxidoreductase RutF